MNLFIKQKLSDIENNLYFPKGKCSVQFSRSVVSDSLRLHESQISFRMDWLDLLAVQGTLKSLLQHHSSKTSILRRSALNKIKISEEMIKKKTAERDEIKQS